VRGTLLGGGGGEPAGVGRSGGWTRCWVLRKRACCPSLGTLVEFLRGGWVCCLWFSPGLLVFPLVWGVWVGAGCCLRTVQWTRASLNRERACFPPLFLGWWGVCLFFVLQFLLIVLCVQVFEGARWMPWHQGPMKDVGACDIPRGAGNQAVIRGFPNGETWHSSWGVARG
jgi:hypothetical protein